MKKLVHINQYLLTEILTKLHLPFKHLVFILDLYILLIKIILLKFNKKRIYFFKDSSECCQKRDYLLVNFIGKKCNKPNENFQKMWLHKCFPTKRIF